MSNNPTSKKLDFLQLLSNDKVIAENETWQPLSKIEIPIIQRDYAQGREGKEELRKNFLTALLTAVKDNKPLELDFVYGTVKDGILQPLDGQQRLTTLFLLHWFIATSGEPNNLDSELKNLLSKFTYETRTSSREFCIDLINKGIIYSDKQTVSEQIIDSSWFFLSWKRDQTIKSMLTMLDDIQKTFKNEKTISLKSLDTISFNFIELQNFGLSDDLYIKMNARGKALSDFENFKAKFEQYVKQNNWENNAEATKKIAHQIDTDWTNLFWDKCEDKGKIDDSILKFMANTAILFYAQNQSIVNNEIETEEVRKELELKSKSKNVTDKDIVERRITKLFNNYKTLKPEDFATESAFDYLKECFNTYTAANNDALHPQLNLFGYVKDDGNLFKDLINEKSSTYKQRVLFYAQSAYLKTIGNSINAENYSDWMRVVRNIVENATIDSATTFIRAINLIKELSIGCNAIYVFLSKSNFAGEQVTEEIKKAKIIIENADAKPIIHQTEDTIFFKGRIGFALYCIDYDMESRDTRVFYKEKLEKILSVITNNFKSMDSILSDDFKRAFLTIGKNNYYEVWNTSWSHSFDCHKRWLLEKTNDLRNFSMSKDWKRDYLKELFNQLVDKVTFKKIIADYVIPDDMPKWKQRLITEENLLKGATYILIPNDDSYCKLAWQQRPNKEDQVEKIN